MPTSTQFRKRRVSAIVGVAMACLSLRPAAARAGELSPAPLAAPVELQLPDLDGQDRRLDEYEGKVVLVNFWASWCTPCIEEMPSIQRLADAMRAKPFAVIGVNVAEGDLRVRTFVKRLGISFLVLLDRDNAVFRRWGATLLPTTYILDGKGVIRYVGLGPLEWDATEIIGMLDDFVAGEAVGTGGGRRSGS